MPTSPVSLLNLPEESLPGIIAELDKRALWHVKGTCRVLRELAEAALRPLLISAEVEVKPSMLIDSKPIVLIVDCKTLADIIVFTPLNCPQGEDLDERGGANWLVNDFFKGQCKAYPPVFDCLRRLKVECWGMDDVGWSIFGNQDLQLQLEHLDIILLDKINESTENVWIDDIDVDDDTRIQLDAYRSWPPSLQNVEHLDFCNLTHLTIAASGRTLSHFKQISSAIPSLRVLTLSAHRRDFVDPSYDPTSILHDIPLDRNLTSLTISGDEVSVSAISRAIGCDNPQIRQLIIHTNGISGFHYRTSCVIARDIRNYESLVSLGLFGSHAWGVLFSMTIIMKGEPQQAYTHLTHLSAEFSHGFSEPNWDDYYHGFPFLDHVSLISGMATLSLANCAAARRVAYPFCLTTSNVDMRHYRESQRPFYRARIPS
jgi:hypothetical protein